jgi:para-nitrobenzyl esterase
MRGILTTSATLLIAALPLTLAAQGPPNATEVAGSTRALMTLPAKNGAKLTVTTPAFKDGGDIPFENTQYKGNVFPGLSWTAGPAGTKSYAIIMQDTDGSMRNSNGLPILHWTIGNIPATITKLDAGMTTAPAGSTYGQNYKGANQPYLGPRTPAGPKHRYHVQVFALDTELPADAMASYATMTAAMKDHVLASGEVVGLGQVMPAGGN